MPKTPKGRRKPAPPPVAEPTGTSGDPVFAANLRRLLAMRGMPAADLAERIAISQQAISQWLTLQTTPTARRVAQVAQALGVTVARFGQDPESDSAVPLRQLELKLSGDRSQPRLDEANAKTGLWIVPREVASVPDERTDVAVITVRDNALEPSLRAGDYVFVDVECRSVSGPGIYLILVARSLAWMRCHPLVGDRVLVSDREVKQEVPAKDLVVLGRAIRLLTRP